MPDPTPATDEQIARPVRLDPECGWCFIDAAGRQFYVVGDGDDSRPYTGRDWEEAAAREIATAINALAAERQARERVEAAAADMADTLLAHNLGHLIPDDCKALKGDSDGKA